jgi:hypothetical protein
MDRQAAINFLFYLISAARGGLYKSRQLKIKQSSVVLPSKSSGRNDTSDFGSSYGRLLCK